MSNDGKGSQTQQREGLGSGHGGPGGMGRGGPMAMGMPAEKAKDARKTLKRLAAYLAPRKGRLMTVAVLAVLSTLFSIMSPKVLGQGISEIFRGVTGPDGIDFAVIGRLMLILVGLYAASSFFTYLTQWLMAGVAQATGYTMRGEVASKLHRLPLSYFDSHSQGDILSRVSNDLDTVSNTLQQGLTQAITSVIIMLGVVIMMLTISPVLTLVTLLVLPLSIVATKGIAGRSQKLFVRQQKVLGELNGHIEETITGHGVVKAFGREGPSIDRFEAMNAELHAVGWKAQFMSGIIMPFMSVINNIGYVFVAVVGGIFVTRRAIQLGDIQAFIQYSRHFSQPIVQLSNIINIIQSTIAAAERVFEILDEEEQPADSPTAVVLAGPRGEVRFDQVRFSYRPEQPLLSGLSIDVKAGQSVAIVGPTGAGKTTLVNLLMRFYEISGGSITVDGTDIREIPRGSLRTIFGMVLQDTWLFKGTIRENIAYGKEDASEQEIIQAARAAQADHFIRTLPEGYDTVLNEESSNISQGQKQLLTIARAFLADPAILILDEATSSVDTRTEVQIQAAMHGLMKGRTNFIIAHRLSTIREADCILVMNEGDIIEQGTHESLLAKQGFYADLHASQFLVPLGSA